MTAHSGPVERRNLLVGTFAPVAPCVLLQANAEQIGVGWICQHELRERLGRPAALPARWRRPLDRRLGRQWRTAVEVELTRKTEARVAAILRQLLKAYDDVVYRAHPSAATVVQRASAALPGGGAGRVHVRPYPPPTLAEVA
jgi:hypothetical protein